MIEYITHHTCGSARFDTDHIIYDKKNTLSIVKSLCLNHKFTYGGYIKAIKHTYGFGYKIPVVLSDELCLIPSGRARDYDTVWINMYAVHDIHPHEDGVIITFSSGRTLYLKISLNTFKRQIKRIQALIAVK